MLAILEHNTIRPSFAMCHRLTASTVFSFICVRQDLNNNASRLTPYLTSKSPLRLGRRLALD